MGPARTGGTKQGGERERHKKTLVGQKESACEAIVRHGVERETRAHTAKNERQAQHEKEEKA